MKPAFCVEPKGGIVATIIVSAPADVISEIAVSKCASSCATVEDDPPATSLSPRARTPNWGKLPLLATRSGTCLSVAPEIACDKSTAKKSET